MSEKSILRAEGLVKTFGKRRVVDGVDLEVHAGEMVMGITDPNPEPEQPETPKANSMTSKFSNTDATPVRPEAQPAEVPVIELSSDSESEPEVVELPAPQRARTSKPPRQAQRPLASAS